MSSTNLSKFENKMERHRNLLIDLKEKGGCLYALLQGKYDRGEKSAIRDADKKWPLAPLIGEIHLIHENIKTVLQRSQMPSSETKDEKQNVFSKLKPVQNSDDSDESDEIAYDKVEPVEENDRDSQRLSTIKIREVPGRSHCTNATDALYPLNSPVLAEDCGVVCSEGLSVDDIEITKCRNTTDIDRRETTDEPSTTQSPVNEDTSDAESFQRCSKNILENIKTEDTFGRLRHTKECCHEGDATSTTEPPVVAGDLNSLLSQDSTLGDSKDLITSAVTSSEQERTSTFQSSVEDASDSCSQGLSVDTLEESQPTDTTECKGVDKSKDGIPTIQPPEKTEDDKDSISQEGIIHRDNKNGRDSGIASADSTILKPDTKDDSTIDDVTVNRG